MATLPTIPVLFITSWQIFWLIVKWWRRLIGFTCERAIHVDEGHLMLPLEGSLFGTGVELDSTEPGTPASAAVSADSSNYRHCDGGAGRAVEVHKSCGHDAHAIVQWQGDPLSSAIFRAETQHIHMAHNSAVHHQCSTGFSPVSNSPGHDALALNTSYLIVDHHKITELNCTHIYPLCSLLTVPSSQWSEDCRLWIWWVAHAIPSRVVLLKDPEAKPALGVDSIVEEFTKWHSLWTDIGVIWWGIGVIMHSVPESKVGSTSSSIVPDNVVGVGDPISGWGDVFIEQAGALLDKHSQVILQDVTGLYAIFDEDAPSHYVVDDIVLH